MADEKPAKRKPRTRKRAGVPKDEPEVKGGFTTMEWMRFAGVMALVLIAFALVIKFSMKEETPKVDQPKVVERNQHPDVLKLNKLWKAWRARMVERFKGENGTLTRTFDLKALLANRDFDVAALEEAYRKRDTEEMDRVAKNCNIHLGLTHLRNAIEAEPADDEEVLFQLACEAAFITFYNELFFERDPNAAAIKAKGAYAIIARGEQIKAQSQKIQIRTYEIITAPPPAPKKTKKGT